MRVVIRADASLAIGTGHVMRCLTLAESLRAGGADVLFICRNHPGNISETIISRGFQLARLQLDADSEDIINCSKSHASWLGVGWEQDAVDTLNVIGDKKIDWIIVDHYALDNKWEKCVRSVTDKILVIDDLADRSHDCDILLDQTYGRSVTEYQEWVPIACVVLTGAEYALLRPEFALYRERSLNRRNSPEINCILVTLGGVDQLNATRKVLQAIQLSRLPLSVGITVVLGATAPWLKDIQELSADLPWSIEVQVNVTNMAELMAKSDLCIGAAGSTAWERCCLGLPTLMVVVAENQKYIAEKLGSSGACVNLGDLSNIQFINQTVQTINEIILDPVGLEKMSCSAAKITDGLGVRNVISKMV
jgi:UDP-2,4-diacetamido-2,4,6-trideoxy-beta-L-altropyranose hydrolase